MEPELSVVEEERAVGNWLTVAEDVATTKARRCSPLHMAACTGAQKVMSYLIDQGAPAYGGRPNPIALAALKGCAPEACELLESALPGGGRAPDDDLGGEAPAQAAAARGFAATALALGAKGLTDPQGPDLCAHRGSAGRGGLRRRITGKWLRRRWPCDAVLVGGRHRFNRCGRRESGRAARFGVDA